jgi:general secretion pathway protein G
MVRHSRHRRVSTAAGMTLLELIIACSILLILSSAAIPIARYSIIRQKERDLRVALRDMKSAIDRYKDMADHNLIRVEVGSEGYPPDLETLVPAQNSRGSDDGPSRMGLACHSG